MHTVNKSPPPDNSLPLPKLAHLVGNRSSLQLSTAALSHFRLPISSKLIVVMTPDGTPESTTPPRWAKGLGMDRLATRASGGVNTGAGSIIKLFEFDSIRCQCLWC